MGAKETIGRLLFPKQHFRKESKKIREKVKSLETELEDLNECVELDECVDRETVVNLIQEIVPSIIGKKGKGSSYLSESSKKSKRIVIRENKAIPHKQQRNARLKKVKRLVV